MDQIDTIQLTMFHERVAKLSSDIEETWYLVKRVVDEMQSDFDFNQPQTLQELRDALEKLEIMMELLQSLKSISQPLSEDYESLIKHHLTKLNQMTEYASSFKANMGVISSKQTPLRVPLPYTNTKAIKVTLERKMGGMEILKRGK